MLQTYGEALTADQASCIFRYGDTTLPTVNHILSQFQKSTSHFVRLVQTQPETQPRSNVDGRRNASGEIFCLS